MLGILLESEARRERRGGGVLLSVVVHVGVLNLAAALTARGSSVTRPPDHAQVRAVHLLPITLRSTTGRPGRGGTRGSPRLVITEFPRVDLSRIPLPLPAVDPTQLVPDRGWLIFPDSGPGAPSFGGGGAILDGPDSASPWIESDVAARLLAPARPRYPDVLRQAGVSGHVLAEFIVDTTGRVDMSSVRIVDATHELFARAVREALPAMRLVPARFQGRKVRVIARLRFEFTLEPPRAP